MDIVDDDEQKIITYKRIPLHSKAVTFNTLKYYMLEGYNLLNSSLTDRFTSKLPKVFG